MTVPGSSLARGTNVKTSFATKFYLWGCSEQIQSSQRPGQVWSMHSVITICIALSVQHFVCGLAVICQIPRAPKLNTKIQCICGAKQPTFSLWDTSNGIVDKKAKIALHTSHVNLNDGGKCKARPKTAGWFRDDHQIIFLTHICWTGKESMTKSPYQTYI